MKSNVALSLWMKIALAVKPSSLHIFQPSSPFSFRLLKTWKFLLDPGVPEVRSMGPVLYNSMSEPPFADLTDVTLADEDTNSILTDNANRAIQAENIQLTKFGTNASGLLFSWRDNSI